MKAERLVSDPERVARHAFLPFIAYDVSESRYDRVTNIVRAKTRPISYSSHADSHIFAYYAHLTKPRLEAAIGNAGVDTSVLAYRRFPGHKCNIHFANEVFDEIRVRGNCAAIAIDVEKFFDSLDHDILKAAWAALLDADRLPSDHYAVYKAITRFAKIDRDALYQEFGLGLRARRRVRGPICTPVEFRERVRGKSLIRTNKTGKGIPQGSPISAILSNLYMLEADGVIRDFATSIGASYRRYSDDLLLICEPAQRDELEAFVVGALEDVELTVNGTKTQRSLFLQTGMGTLTCDNPLPYLGFTFDGERKLVRSKTLARYTRRVSQGVESAARAARKAGKSGGNPKIRRAEIYERYSHLGKRNFISYAYRAAEIMGDNSPKRQVRKHWKRLHDKIAEANGDP